MQDPVTYFAETDSRNKRLKFGIKESDRSRHMYVIGKTGMGKSTLLENMAVQDIQNGNGMAFIDPHGKTADLLLDYVPKERIKDVLYFAPFDLDYPVSFNVMEDVGYERRHLVANGLMSAFKKIWVDAWSARMEYILNNILLSLLEYPDATLIGVNRMLVDKEYRNRVVANITDPSVKAFWTDEFAKYGDRYMQEAGAAIQNKIGQFISNPLVRNIIGQPKSTFDLRKMMDEKKIIIINLSKGRVGEANANLLGSMLITKIYLAAMSRADVSPGMLGKLANFYLYVDEFQSFANESFADILSEARKYKLNLLIAHQYIEQMSDEVRAAVFGNVGSMIAFRVGAYDAEILEKEFAPVFTEEDMVNLGFVQIYLKLMIDGVTSQPFSAVTLAPIAKPLISFKEEIIRFSRDTFARPRAEVEEAIKKWHEPILPAPRPRDNRQNYGDRQQGFQDRHNQPGQQPHSSPQSPQSPQNSQATQGAQNQPAQGQMAQGQVAQGQPAQPQRGQSSEPPQFSQPSTKIIESLRKEGHNNPPPRMQTPRSETELRNVINQSYEKKAAEDRAAEEKKKAARNQQKGPTRQNISALRDALATVMKEVQRPQSEATAKIQTESAPKAPAVQSTQSTQETQPSASAPASENSASAPMDAHASASVPPHASHSHSGSHSRHASSHTQNHASQHATPHEVPEKVLRQVLEIDG